MAHRADRTDIRALGRLTRHPVCPTHRLAEVAGIPPRTLANAVEGLSALSVPDLRLVLGAMVRLGQEEDALELVRGLLDLPSLGWDLRHAARLSPAASLAVAGLHAAGAAGEAVAAISEAAADGKITESEAARIEGPVAHARHRLDALIAHLRGLPTGQASLPGVGR